MFKGQISKLTGFELYPQPDFGYSSHILQHFIHVSRKLQKEVSNILTETAYEITAVKAD
jgi:hypothetical protein